MSQSNIPFWLAVPLAVVYMIRHPVKAARTLFQMLWGNEKEK